DDPVARGFAREPLQGELRGDLLDRTAPDEHVVPAGARAAARWWRRGAARVLPRGRGRGGLLDVVALVTQSCGEPLGAFGVLERADLDPVGAARRGRGRCLRLRNPARGLLRGLRR